MTVAVDAARPVRPGEELDQTRLEAYLLANLPGTEAPLTVRQFPSGFSNLTYLVTLGSRAFVLRRPPFGNVVKSAHDMGREYRVLSRLSPVYPPAPRPHLYCEDDAVLGAPFYVMERRSGVVLRRGAAPGVLADDPDAARRLSEAFVDNMAHLHSLDYHAAGLGDLGKPNGYVRRQVEGWTKRYHKAKTDEVPEVEHIAGWLAAECPDDGTGALIHNDYKYDNLVLAADDPTRIVAVLDWEMATIGDPLMDLGMSLAYWVEATDSPARREEALGPTTLPGSLTRREVIARYERATGRVVSAPLFYYCFGLFKLIGIVQQIYARFVRGHTADRRFAQLDNTVRVLAATGVEAIDDGRL